MAGPLTGLRVLDLSRVLAGPWATQCLADMGAEVIKIERPGVGDDTRHWGPPFFGPEADGLAAYYMSINRGKYSVELDITSAEGQETLRQLVKHCDILVENFKVGGLEKYGLDYDSLKAVHPGLIYCSITGFGQAGPYKKRPGYDLMIQALGGLMSLTGEGDDKPGGGPQKAGVAVVDLFTGLYATIAILGALHHREKTGEGQHIDMALLDTTVSILSNQSLSYLVSREVPKRRGNSHPSIVPYQSFETKDGYIILAVGNDSQFSHFATAAGMPALASDERFASNPARVTHRDELVSILEGVMRGHTTQEWVTLLEQASVPCGPINTLDKVFANEQVKARGIEITLENTKGALMPGVANPIHYSGTPLEYTKAPPFLGEDTDAILKRFLKS